MNIAQVEAKRILANGIKMFELKVQNDFEEAQSILDMADVTKEFCSREVYSERVEHMAVGTYLINVDRYQEYNEFCSIIIDYKNDLSTKVLKMAEVETEKEVGETWDNMRKSFHFNKITRNEFEEFRKKFMPIYEEKKEVLQNVKETKRLLDFSITLEEWKTGKMKSGMKVGKALGKAGFLKEVLDFYSAQVKTERECYITISDRVQHIAGMSNYAKEHSWTSYNGTTCQDTRHDGSECIGLVGNIHDNKVFVAMMHEKMEDLENMFDKLIARTILRYVTIEGKGVLIPLHYYGNTSSPSELKNGLKQLEEMNVFDYDGNERVQESIKIYNYLKVVDVHHNYIVDEFVMIACPRCDGTRRNYMPTVSQTVECQACDRSGKIRAQVYKEIDKYVETQITKKVYPYEEGFSLYVEGDNRRNPYIRIHTDVEYIKNKMKEFGYIPNEKNQVTFTLF